MEEGDVGEAAQNVQLSYPFDGYSQVVANTTSAMAQSTGAIRNVNLDANTNHASCGATFISRHHAITAAHCVPNIALNNGTVTVEQYTTTNLNTFAITFFSSTVSGNWPNWTMGGPLQAHDGYSVTSMTCRVRRRCHPVHGGVQNCPAQVSANGPVDIALLECSTRNNANYAATTNDNALGRDVETWWFHEIVNLPTTPSTTDQYWLHYGQAPGADHNDNYHYRVRHQLFPLRSTGRPRLFNTPLNYKDLGHEGTITWMDTPICHGTSGSGVFLNGMNVVLGPAINGGFITWTDPSGVVRPLLCHRAEQNPAGRKISTHIRADITHAFVRNSPEVLADF